MVLLSGIMSISFGDFCNLPFVGTDDQYSREIYLLQVVARSQKTYHKLFIPGITSYTLVRTMKISARNILKGKVKAITPGSINSEVVLVLPGGQEITSIITKKSVATLGLSVGKEAYAVVKSSEVMIAVD